MPGEAQSLDDGLRDRSGAFPLKIPNRLISMFSVRGDTVLDPFLGTGTTTLSAMMAGRNSVGVERDPELVAALEDRVDGVGDRSQVHARERLDAHREWVKQRRADGTEPEYEAEHYDFPVTTKQERQIRFYAVEDVERTDEGYRVSHVPVE